MVARLGLPPKVLDAILVKESFGNERWTKLSVWLAMVLEANPGVVLATNYARDIDAYGVSVKKVGERTMTFYFRLDGTDLFLSYIGDALEFMALTRLEDRALLEQVLLKLSGSDQAETAAF